MISLDRPDTPPRPLSMRAPKRLVEAPHAVALSGLRSPGQSARRAPTLVERRDANPVEGLLDDLGQSDTLDSLRTAPLPRRAGTVRLFAPVQRVMNGVVIEAFCTRPGQPRLDPRAIDSAGFVLRRMLGTQRLAWLREGSRQVGWEAVDEEQDPAADRRRLDVTLGHPAIDALTPAMRRLRTAGSTRLARATRPVSEPTQPLFVAPPRACEATGRTLLFGTLAFPADERSEAEPQKPVYGQTPEEREALRRHLSPALQAHASPLQVTFGGEAVSLSRLTDDHDPRGLRTLIEQLHLEFDAFGGTGTSCAALREALATLQVERDVSTSTGLRTETAPAWPFLQQAQALLFDTTDASNDSQTLPVPHRFAALSAADATTLFDALLAQLSTRHAQVLSAGSRFEADGRDVRYVLRAFVRLKPEHAGCPPQLLWSDYSEPFTLAAWHESAGVPGPVVPMPDLTDRDVLKALKPNVAFQLPPRLAGLLRSDPAKLAKGEGSPQDARDLGVDWICSFSIPIITVCAFIVLNIFLQLLNLVFRWLPFLKVCIPLPRSRGPQP